ncbi:helix-turn-helix domain-containing protein [Ktedonosporobacter rubrisoli]|uniref:helix-turn-helix domain-containing protein n=1 Tax=Ktedonosporobacter rubrisoli TaxID=2509675 RepID=UPI0013EE4DA9|nr:helix-turn-helix transcriptional regulator [Ktedonosporobacter rubrisoli]
MLRLRVKEIAQEKRIGLAKLSRLSDISYKTIQKIWRNPYHDASLSTINRIARVLRVPTKDLLEDVAEEQVPEEYRLPLILTYE